MSPHLVGWFAAACFQGDAVDAGAAADLPVEAPSLVLNAALLALGLFLVPLALRGLARFAPPARRPPASWGVLHVLLALAVGFLLPPLFLGEEVPQHPLAQIFAGQAALGAAAAVGVIYARRTADGVESLGFLPDGNARGIAIGLAFYLACAPAVSGAANLWVALSIQAGWGAEQEVLRRLLELHGTEAAIAASLAVGLAPFLEELFFRGFVQPVFVRRIGPLGGVLVTSSLFALLHGPVAFGAIFSLSLVLGTLQERTGRLSVVVVVHAFHNALILLLSQLSPS